MSELLYSVMGTRRRKSLDCGVVGAYMCTYRGMWQVAETVQQTLCVCVCVVAAAVVISAAIPKGSPGSEWEGSYLV